jgi:signal transduction histidine kinase
MNNISMRGRKALNLPAAQGHSTSASAQETQPQHLYEALLLEQQLRDMTRQILISTDCEQQRLSLELHEDLIQMLLGIHVNLLALKGEAAISQAAFTRSLVSTQRIVKRSIKTIDRFARDLAPAAENEPRLSAKAALRVRPSKTKT